MKKLLAYLILVPLIANSQIDSGINFDQSLSWQQVKVKAKRENKHIFIDCYTTWCGPCRLMDEKVFSNDSVGSFMNRNFVSVRLQMDKTEKDNVSIKRWYGQSDEFNRLYTVASYPTYFYFSADGEIVHRSGSYQDPAVFVSTSKKALDPRSQYYTMLLSYEKGAKNYDNLPYLIKTTHDLGDAKLEKRLSDEYAKYLYNLNRKELYTSEKITFIAVNIQNSDSKYFAMFYPNGEKVNQVMGQSGFARRVIDSVIAREMINPLLSLADDKDEPNWDAIREAINRKYGADYAERNVLWNRARWCDNHKDMPGYTKYFVKLVGINGMDTTYGGSDGWLNWVAFDNIFSNSSNKEEINAAVKWMKGVANRNSNNHYLVDTYAELLYKAGRKEEGITWEEKVVDIAERQSDKKAVEHYKELVDKMKRGEPTWPEETDKLQK